MSPWDTSRITLRKLPCVRGIIARWRALTGGSTTRDQGRRTLVACSGGADSCALVLALAAATKNLVVAHVVHDMRSKDESLADKAVAHALADSLALPFVFTPIRARECGGNLESASRVLRYRALSQMAATQDCIFVATGHHADDQLETMLMRLSRGAGIRGLAGIRESRLLPGLSGSTARTLIRPMLGFSHQDALDICGAANWTWAEDATNHHLSSGPTSRAALRAQVIPLLKGNWPRILGSAEASAWQLGQAAEVISGLARNLLGEAVRKGGGSGTGLVWRRSALRERPAIVVAECLLLAREEFMGLHKSAKVRQAVLRALVERINDSSTDPKSMVFAGMAVSVTAKEVAVRKAE